MRTLPYRTKKRIRKAFQLFGIAVAAAVVLILAATVYLERYLVFTEDGAHLDFSRSTAKDVAVPGSTADPGETLPSVEIIEGDPSSGQHAAAAVSGVYVDLEMLQHPAAVLEALQELEPCTVMIDLKGGNGNFYYSTAIAGSETADIDVATVDTILSYLKSNGFSMIARVKTFQDTAFALAHFDSGIQETRGYLWVGSGFYWLDPASDAVADYLKQIARELAGKGFREIVFDDFAFPSGSSIAYSSDKSRTEVVQDLATELMNFFASSNVTISFGNPTGDFVPGASSHVFISGVDGSGVNAKVNSLTGVADKTGQIVFLTASKDTRFEGYQVLRPLLN